MQLLSTLHIEQPHPALSGHCWTRTKGDTHGAGGHNVIAGLLDCLEQRFPGSQVRCLCKALPLLVLARACRRSSQHIVGAAARLLYRNVPC